MAYRNPWTGGAKAYPEADTFADLWEGVKRKRKSLLVHMPNDGEAGDILCASCGIKLRDIGPDASKPDQWSTWTVYPREKKAVAQHYYCSWGSLMQEIFDKAWIYGY